MLGFVWLSLAVFWRVYVKQVWQGYVGFIKSFSVGVCIYIYICVIRAWQDYVIFAWSLAGSNKVDMGAACVTALDSGAYVRRLYVNLPAGLESAGSSHRYGFRGSSLPGSSKFYTSTSWKGLLCMSVFSTVARATGLAES